MVHIIQRNLDVDKWQDDKYLCYLINTDIKTGEQYFDIQDLLKYYILLVDNFNHDIPFHTLNKIYKIIDKKNTTVKKIKKIIENS